MAIPPRGRPRLQQWVDVEQAATLMPLQAGDRGSPDQPSCTTQFSKHRCRHPMAQRPILTPPHTIAPSPYPRADSTSIICYVRHHADAT